MPAVVKIFIFTLFMYPFDLHANTAVQSPFLTLFKNGVEAAKKPFTWGYLGALASKNRLTEQLHHPNGLVGLLEDPSKVLVAETPGLGLPERLEKYNSTEHRRLEKILASGGSLTAQQIEELNRLIRLEEELRSIAGYKEGQESKSTLVSGKPLPNTVTFPKMLMAPGGAGGGAASGAALPSGSQPESVYVCICVKSSAILGMTKIVRRTMRAIMTTTTMIG